MTTKNTAGHTPELFAALETFIKSGSANGRENMREKCLAYIAAAPETAAERDRLRGINSELVAALTTIANDLKHVRGCALTYRSIARAALARHAKATA